MKTKLIRTYVYWGSWRHLGFASYQQSDWPNMYVRHLALGPFAFYWFTNKGSMLPRRVK